MLDFGKITAITGHYGSGKTNLAVNLAVDFAKRGEKVTIVDLDIVNPYFRTADFAELFNSLGIKLVYPRFANTNLDIPSIGFDMAALINGCDRLILDVGGDDSGAIALGQFSAQLNNSGCKLYCVVNKYRYLTKTAEEAAQLLRETEASARIRTAGIINCSNLGSETTAEDVENSVEYAKKLSELTGVPLVMTAAERSLNIKNAYPIDIYVRPFWEEK